MLNSHSVAAQDIHKHYTTQLNKTFYFQLITKPVNRFSPILRTQNFQYKNYNENLVSS